MIVIGGPKPPPCDCEPKCQDDFMHGLLWAMMQPIQDDE